MADAAIQEARGQILKAAHPPDLDTLVWDLTALRDELANLDSRAGNQARVRFNVALRFATQWQSYLAALDAGRPANAHEILSQLAGSTQNGDDGSFFPHSEVLARLQALPDPNERREIARPPAPPPFESFAGPAQNPG